ncbi:MAG: Uncharacterised protein [Flavobacterium sp. SCGC AAA160-P02]|nr:MAG: Uncharacterised protein [Flavobacterium sp. SCGC AAA160-P02]
MVMVFVWVIKMGLYLQTHHFKKLKIYMDYSLINRFEETTPFS